MVNATASANTAACIGRTPTRRKLLEENSNQFLLIGYSVASKLLVEVIGLGESIIRKALKNSQSRKGRLSLRG